MLYNVLKCYKRIRKRKGKKVSYIKKNKSTLLLKERHYRKLSRETAKESEMETVVCWGKKSKGCTHIRGIWRYSSFLRSFIFFYRLFSSSFSGLRAIPHMFLGTGPLFNRPLLCNFFFLYSSLFSLSSSLFVFLCSEERRLFLLVLALLFIYILPLLFIRLLSLSLSLHSFLFTAEAK